MRLLPPAVRGDCLTNIALSARLNALTVNIRYTHDVNLPRLTTIFTIGLLAFAVPPTPRSPLVGPLLWCAVGAQAAFFLGVRPDLGLVAAAAAGIGLWVTAGNRYRVLES